MITTLSKNMGLYTTTIEIATGEELYLEVAFDFQPYEPATRHYPGCDAEVGIYEAMVIYPDGIRAEVCLLEQDTMAEEILEAITEFNEEPY